jgi:hypothetical protein
VTESVKALPKTAAVTLQEQWTRCGKPTCRCAAGSLHGPYVYLFWRDGGRQHKSYVRKADVAEVRSIVSELQQEQQRQRALERRYQRIWRECRDQLREHEQWLSH